MASSRVPTHARIDRSERQCSGIALGQYSWNPLRGEEGTNSSCPSCWDAESSQLESHKVSVLQGRIQTYASLAAQLRKIPKSEYILPSLLCQPIIPFFLIFRTLQSIIPE